MVEASGAIFACRCLNVRIRPQMCRNSPPESLGCDPEYESVYVGDEGILIANPQVTLRTRHRGVPDPNSDPDPEKLRCNRYMSLSCLICQMVVYRVLQNILAKMEEKAGPMLPTDDWVEQETLKSATGWIELHKGCLTGDAIAIAERSPTYSSLFAIVLPSPPPALTEVEPDATYTTVSQSPPQHTPTNYLPNLRPIFPPAPFTPSHPIFVHLSSLAAEKSQALRTDAENYIAEVVKQKVAEIEKADNELRSNVETLWRSFREGLRKVEQERSRSSTRTPQRSKDSGNWQEGTDAGSSKPSPAFVSIRDFNPVQSPRKVASPTFTPRVSSLSASLATSAFHHPRAQAHQGRSALPHVVSATNENLRSPPPYSSNPSSPRTSDSYSSLSSPSSKSLSLRASLDGPTFLEPFKRNMNLANDTATSFRYFTILEADTNRTQQKAGTAHVTTVNSDDASRNDSETSKTERKTERSNSSGSRSSKERSSSACRKTDINETSGTNGQENSSKGKRKVTFDVKPEVVTIAREVKAERKEDAERSAEEMIFDLEDEASERGIAPSNPVLQLNEPPIAPSRPRRTRGAHAGLPSSFSSLRPASLPAPSAIRPPRAFDTEDTSQPKRSTQNRKKSPHRDVKQANLRSLEEDSETINSRDAEILKLVAADTPSHRGAWKKDSKAWQLFDRRQGGKGRQSGGLIPEEDESDPDALAKFKEDNDTDGESDSDIQNDSTWAKSQLADLAISLPVSIHPLTRTRETLSLASYQPKTSLADRPGILVPSLHPPRKSGPGRLVASSAAWRKAAYAERDRSRYMDPGALDFAFEEEDDDDDHNDHEATRTSADQDGRGHQHALKILQMRSEVPASGMWRSLA